MRQHIKNSIKKRIAPWSDSFLSFKPKTVGLFRVGLDFVDDLGGLGYGLDG